MKTILALWLLMPSVLLAQTNGLTLVKVRKTVLAENPAVQQAVHRIAAANAVLRQAHSAYAPQISFSGSYGHVDASLHPDIDPMTRYADSMMQGTLGLQANWLLLDGYARQARELAARQRVKQSKQVADETRRLLVLSATVAFRQAQLAAENIRIAEQDRQFNRTLEADARKRFDAGTLPEADVHNFSIRALQAESAALQARLAYETACAVLAELMALPEAQLSDFMQPASIRFTSPQAVPGLDAELPYALAHRPDYKALMAESLALAQQERAARADRGMKIALTGTLNYIDREGYSESSHHGNYDSFIGLTGRWELLTGGRLEAVVTQTQAQRRALYEQREALRLSIRSALRQRIDEAETAGAVYERQEQIYELTQSVRDSVEKAYKAGVAPITRLNEAQTDLVRARGAYAGACIAYQLSLNTLEIETGRILEHL